MKQIFENTAQGAESSNSDDDDGSEAWSESPLSQVLPQMMFVSGETAEPSIETTGMIEDIVRQQVVEMVCNAK